MFCKKTFKRSLNSEKKRALAFQWEKSFKELRMLRSTSVDNLRNKAYDFSFPWLLLHQHVTYAVELLFIQQLNSNSEATEELSFVSRLHGTAIGKECFQRSWEKSNLVHTHNVVSPKMFKLMVVKICEEERMAKPDKCMKLMKMEGVFSFWLIVIY